MRLLIVASLFATPAPRDAGAWLKGSAWEYRFEGDVIYYWEMHFRPDGTFHEKRIALDSQQEVSSYEGKWRYEGAGVVGLVYENNDRVRSKICFERVRRESAGGYYESFFLAKYKFAWCGRVKK